MNSHTCHAALCTVGVPQAMFMCRRHWALVPAPMQRAIWSTYRRGQEIDKRPSQDYLEAARRAIRAVALREGIRYELRAFHAGTHLLGHFSRERPEMPPDARASGGPEWRLIDLAAEELFSEPLDA